MYLTAHKILTLAGMLLVVTLTAAAAGAESYLNGSAEISYVNFDAEVNGKEVYSGDSLAQRYSLAWSATNLYYRSQPRYYVVTLGYDWTSFDTKIHDNGTNSELSQTFGKFSYNGEIGYNPVDQPVRFKAYASNLEPLRFKNNIYHGLLDDGLTLRIEGMSKGYTTGVSFVFESERALTSSLRQLPRVYLDYRETVNKAADSANIDDKISELSVAGLNKENNWLQYRNIKYENFRKPIENYEQQQIQIGLVDQLGRRQWAALTNWINVSADGSFGNKKGINSGDYQEEYDVNFYAIATRRYWEARTLMNYNREVLPDMITEKTRVPFLVKGVWSSDVDWYANVTANRGRELTTSGRVDTSYSNNVTIGANMFKRSSFTLAPVMAITTSKAFTGGDAYDARLGVSTTSTSYYSNKVSLFAGYQLNVLDNGSGSADSMSWSNNVKLKGQYMPSSRLTFVLREEVEYGKGSGYLDKSRLSNALVQQSGLQQYARLVSFASVHFTASSSFSAAFDGSHDYVQTANAPASSSYHFSSNLYYNSDSLFGTLSSRYDHNDISTTLNVIGQLQYRPNRYHEALVRTFLDKNSSGNNDTTSFILLQNYSHKMFSRSGVMRSIAVLSEEFSYSRVAVNSTMTDSAYLLLSGRYSPTAKISLYGSVKYQVEHSASTIFYNAGAAMDFKLLTTTLDYSLAKRDSDSRIEKRLSASVKRTF